LVALKEIVGYESTLMQNYVRQGWQMGLCWAEGDNSFKDGCDGGKGLTYEGISQDGDRLG